MLSIRYLDDMVTLKQDISRCIGCGMCLEVCPHAVWKMENRIAVIADKNACMECGACMKNCPADAIEMESGVGCARAIINGFISGTTPNCDCSSGCC